MPSVHFIRQGNPALQIGEARTLQLKGQAPDSAAQVTIILMSGTKDKPSGCANMHFRQLLAGIWKKAIHVGGHL